MRNTELHPAFEDRTHEDRFLPKSEQIKKLGKSAIRYVESYFREPDDCKLSESLKTELKDSRVYTGEATGYKRAVWFLGREYINNDIPVVVTKPLGVKLPGYMTEHLTTICEATKRPMLVLGSVGFNESRNFTFDEEKRFHMSWMASDIFNILEQVETDKTNNWPGISLQNFDVAGASQGAMVGMDMIAQSKYFDREIRKGVFVGAAGLIPAREKKVGPIVNFIKLAKQFGYDEPKRFAIHFLRSPVDERVRMLTRFAPTLSVPKSAIKPVVITACQILNGPMRGIGNTLRSQENDTDMSLLLFEDDTASSPYEWFEELRPDIAPHISIEIREGGHISGIVHPDTDQYFIENLKPYSSVRQAAS